MGSQIRNRDLAFQHAACRLEMRRGSIEDLDVTVTLTGEDGQKVIYPQCVLP